MMRDLRERVLKPWRKLRSFFYLCWAPFGVRPSSFRTEDSPYKDLGWSVPLTPGLIWAFATKPLMRPMVDLWKSKLPEGNIALDVLRDSAEWLPHAVTIATFFCIIYASAFGSWAFHGAICWAFRRAGQTAKNAPFEFYLVRGAGVSTILGVFAVAVFVPAFAESSQMAARRGHLGGGPSEFVGGISHRLINALDDFERAALHRQTNDRGLQLEKAAADCA
jgi:hypothetical protein